MLVLAVFMILAQISYRMHVNKTQLSGKADTDYGKAYQDNEIPSHSVQHLAYSTIFHIPYNI